MTQISIITVVYNGEKTIEDTIKSIVAQKNIDLEYIIIDGKSSDNTINIISLYQDNVSVLLSENDDGIYDAMNKGLKLAKGEIIGFLNADDVYNNSEILNKIVSTFESNIHTDIIYGDLVYVKQDDVSHVVRYWRSETYFPNFFNDGLVPPHPSFFARKHVYQKAGNFNTKFKFAADYEIMFRLLKIHNFSSLYIPEILVRMRIGGTTNNSWKNITNGNLEIWNVWKIHKQSVSIFFWLKRNIAKIEQFLKKS